MRRNLFVFLMLCLMFMGMNLLGDDTEPVIRYKISNKSISEEWVETSFDDSEWMEEHAGRGPMLWKLGPMTVHQGTTELDGKILKAVQPLPERGFYAKRAVFYWEPLQTENNPVVNFRKGEGLGGFGYVYYMRSTVIAWQECDAELQKGFLSFMWVNGAPVDIHSEKVHLKKGANQVIFKFANVGPEFEPEVPYFKADGKFLQYDCMEESVNKEYVGYYRFQVPKDTKLFTIRCCGRAKPQIFLNGKELNEFAQKVEGECEGGKVYGYKIALPDGTEGGLLSIKLLHITGLYGGNSVKIRVRDCEGDLLK